MKVVFDLEPAPRKGPAIRSAWRLAMRARLEQPQARTKYRLRKQTIEPVFGVLKRVMGFTHFRLRGLAGMSLLRGGLERGTR